jgi:uncharacterized protein YaaR (DUF327 family)
MDKVDLSNNPAALLNSAMYGGVKGEAKKAGKKPALREGRGVNFSDVLENSTALDPLGPVEEFAPSEAAVQELLDAVRSAGDDLKQRPLPDEILRYKKAVRNFLHHVVQNSYEVKESQTMLRKKKELRPHVQVQVVDRKLEQLAAGILAGQVSQLELLSKLEEITGLLVDMVS